jgi:hypothetical protein
VVMWLTGDVVSFFFFGFFFIDTNYELGKTKTKLISIYERRKKKEE